MDDTFTTEDRIRAKDQGWCLEYVFDTERNKWLLCVLPLDIMGDARQVLAVVMSRAKQRDLLCIKALRMIHQHNLKGSK